MAEREGIGFQFQLTLNGKLYGGTRQSAYYVAQIQLVRRKTSVAWQVDAMPLLEAAGERYDLYGKRPFTVAFHDRAGLQDLFVTQLTDDAKRWFNMVRAGDIPDEPPAQRGGPPLRQSAATR